MNRIVKRALGLTLSLALALSLLPAQAAAVEEPTSRSASVAAKASTPAVISADKVSAHPGQTVRVPLRMQKNPGVVSVKLEIGYDSSVMTLVEAKDCGLLGDTYYGGDLSANPYTVMWVNPTIQANLTGTGVMTELVFKVKDSSPQGSYPIRISYGLEALLDVNLNEVPCTPVAGAVNVQPSQPEANTCTVTVDGKTFTDVPQGTLLGRFLPEIPAKAGHTFLGWFDGGTQVNAYTAVNHSMNITSQWAFNVFTDVKPTDWFYNGVRYTTFNGLFSGVSPTQFGPSIRMNRAMVVQVLYSLAGKPAVMPNTDFKDVPVNQWYAKAVAWAVENGVASGYGGGLFGPEDIITREQLAAMLYSFAGKPYASIPMDFADADQISGWARSAMQWAVENNIMGGVGGNCISPKTTATRAEAAVMLTNFHKLQK